jgi:hypothetical protein
VAVCAFDKFLDLSGSTEPSAAHKLSASDEPRVYRTFCSQVDSRGNGATAKKLRKNIIPLEIRNLGEFSLPASTSFNENFDLHLGLMPRR